MNGIGFRRFWVITCWFAIIFMIAPIIVVVAGSFTQKEFLSLPLTGVSLRWYANILAHPEFVNGFLKSIQLATIAALLATVLGTLAAIGLVRHSPQGTGPVSIVLLLPLMVPSVIIGISVLQFFTTLHITTPYVTLVLGHAVITFPYVVRTVVASLSLMERDIEWAAANLGASPLRVIWHITVPNIRPGLVGGLIFAFMVSFDVVTVSLFLQTPDFVPLPVHLYNFVEFGVSPVLAALSTLLIIFSAIGIFAAERIAGLGVIFGGQQAAVGR